uniref:RanBD1 domain-containing protein n=1 Tax=Hydatigena taeniaeformis TaxID=6205 RepID=A0A0R3XCT2_HYDTA
LKLKPNRPLQAIYFSFRSTDSEASDSSVSSGQTCQIKRIASFNRPQRFFTLSLPRTSEKTILLHVPSTEAVTPTNQPRRPVNCSPDIPTIFLQPPDPDEGPKTPTLPYNDATEITMAKELSTKEEVVKSHEEQPPLTIKSTNEEKKVERRGSSNVKGGESSDKDVEKNKGNEEIGDKNNECRSGDQNENISSKVEEEEAEGRTYLSPMGENYIPDSTSQESLLNVASPFGDAAKVSFFTNLDSNRLRLGVLDLKVSNSMTSITIPLAGCAPTASQREQ